MRFAYRPKGVPSRLRSMTVTLPVVERSFIPAQCLLKRKLSTLCKPIARLMARSIHPKAVSACILLLFFHLEVITHFVLSFLLEPADRINYFRVSYSRWLVLGSKKCPLLAGFKCPPTIHELFIVAVNQFDLFHMLEIYPRGKNCNNRLKRRLYFMVRRLYFFVWSPLE